MTYRVIIEPTADRGIREAYRQDIVHVLHVRHGARDEIEPGRG